VRLGWEECGQVRTGADRLGRVWPSWEGCCLVGKVVAKLGRVRLGSEEYGVLQCEDSPGPGEDCVSVGS
jgi:hypothetical protein